MEQFDREDSSKYNSRQNQPERVEQQVAQPITPAPKQKKSKAPLVLSSLLLLALLATTSIGWLWFQQSDRVDNLESDLSVARNNIASLESAANANEKLEGQVDSPEGMQAELSDKDALTKAAKAYVAAQVNGQPAKVTVTVGKIELPFATVNVSGEVGGAACIYKKSGDQWLWLYCAQSESEHTKMMDSTYGVPRSVIQS